MYFGGRIDRICWWIKWQNLRRIWVKGDWKSGVEQLENWKNHELRLGNYKRSLIRHSVKCRWNLGWWYIRNCQCLVKQMIRIMRSSNECLLIKKEEMSKDWTLRSSDFRRLGRWGTSRGETEKEWGFLGMRRIKRELSWKPIKNFFKKESMFDQ